MEALTSRVGSSFTFYKEDAGRIANWLIGNWAVTGVPGKDSKGLFFLLRRERFLFFSFCLWIREGCAYLSCAWYGVLSGMAFVVYFDWMQLWIGGIINFFLLNLLSTRLYQNWKWIIIWRIYLGSKKQYIQWNFYSRQLNITPQSGTIMLQNSLSEELNTFSSQFSKDRDSIE